MNETIKFTEVPTFSEKQLDKQLKKQLEFLKIIYPFLESDSWNEGAIELRPIKRNSNIKTYVRSYNTWRLDVKDVDALRKFLNLINGKAYCLYYSAFTFNYSKDCFKANGKKFEKGKINNQNAIFTCILPMDFDDLSYDEFLEEKKKLLDLEIETLDIATGHGFQSIILLNSKVHDLSILNKFTKMMISKGFKVDPSLVDAARLLRLPYTFNCKSIDEDNKHYSPLSSDIIPTTVINWSNIRYNVSDIFKKVKKLPTVIEENDLGIDYNLSNIKTELIPESRKEDIICTETKNIKIESLNEIYNMIDFNKLPDAIKKMLNCSKSGIRNKVLLFLIPFLRNNLGCNIQTIKQVLKIWGERCIPILNEDFIEKEVNRIYSYNFKSKYGVYTEELRKVYGFLEFEKYSKNNKTIIPNCFFDDFDAISDGSVKIFLALKLAEATDRVKEFSRLDIQQYAKISERTMERNIKDLVNMGYLCKKRANRRSGEKYIYYINPYFNITSGFTILENSTIKLMQQELTDGEIKLYSYMRRMIGDSEQSCWASQKYLAKKVGKKGHFSISKMTDNLMNKKFINKTVENKNGISHAIYSLNY